ncbi:ATP-binding protein [Methylibium sp.]|uniref:GAF domain-containing sensor histidine kinase n=1 Tax=Methylibium sp. TaxID=2067992 RepID=UPI00183B7767|nr:ATP-binding protein [Methylibium sp.]MBA3589644.1 GAF domain-containing protein [Methylibium sp.]
MPSPTAKPLSARVAALHSYGVLDTPREADFDDLVQLASEICQTPFSVVNLIDESRQWFKAEIGFGVRETPLDSSICAQVMLEPDLVEIGDLTQDTRFACNPLITAGPQLRFYAGAPLTTAEGHVLGTLCVLDTQPRRLEARQRAALRALGNQVVAQLEVRRQARLMAERAERLTQLARASRAINAELSLDRIVALLTDESRALTGALAATASVPAMPSRGAVLEHRSPPPGSDDVAVPEPDDDTLAASVRSSNRAQRRAPLSASQAGPASGGWLGVPLLGSGQRNLGLLYAVHAPGAAFTDADEAALTQLAAVAAIGIEHATLVEALLDQDRRKDEYLATIAHELRNPLAPLRTGLELLRRAGTLDEGALRTRDMMERQVLLMVRLVDDLLDASRVGQGKLALRTERLVLADVVREAVESSAPLVEAAAHKLTLRLPQQPVQLAGDAMRLAQVFGNLLNNAAKYTPAGGSIELRATVAGAVLSVTVADNGAGIPPEMLDAVFKLFTQVGRHQGMSQGGLGIGLSLAREIVTLHGGTLTAHSDGVGRGAAFTVTLPVEKAAGDAG